ncbi:MAG: DKNYY domain-containing protein, partial [Dietzia sp.]|nr:DKNYY domain-containing protein [Dietzia sp.]
RSSMCRSIRCFDVHMRKITAAALVLAVAVSAGCSSSEVPDSQVDDAGYHIRDDTGYYLNPFPGKVFELSGADPSSFEVFDRTYARDDANVYINGHLLPGAQADSFELLKRPGFSRDGGRVYQHDRPISVDPDNFELLDSGLAKDSTTVYWSDGTVLSDDPQGFEIISDVNHYLFAKDSRTVYVNGNPIRGAAPATFRVLQGAYSRDDDRAFYFDGQIPDAELATFRPVEGPYAVDSQHVYWMGKPIDGADPATFVILNANFECSSDGTRAFHRQAVIVSADPATFPPGRAVTGCSETSMSFGD